MEFKPFYKNNHDAEAHRLADCEEARGELLRVFESEGQCITVFSWGCCSFPEELREELAPLVGRTVAILRLDRYHVRAVGAGHA
jgi:hypothetical protein